MNMENVNRWIDYSTRIEEEMRENHPYFDRPLFVVGRVSKLRDVCKRIVHAKYEWQDDTANTNTKSQRRYKQLQSVYSFTLVIERYRVQCNHEISPFSSLIGLMPYLDWTMVTITIMSCISMLFESPWPTTGENLVMNNFYLQVSWEISIDQRETILDNGLHIRSCDVIWIGSEDYIEWFILHSEGRSERCRRSYDHVHLFCEWREKEILDEWLYYRQV